MNRAEFAFMISYLKKAIYNLERAKAYNASIVSDEVISNLKSKLDHLLETKGEDEDE